MESLNVLLLGTVYYYEAEIGEFQKENVGLKGEKRLLEYALKEESSKRMKL